MYRKVFVFKSEKGRKMSQSLRPGESGSSERNRNQIRRVRGGSDGSVVPSSVPFGPPP